MRLPGSALERRVLAWQAAFALGTAFLVAPLVPRLLLLSGPVQEAITRVLLYSVGTGGVVALIHNALVLARHRALFVALVSEPSTVKAPDLAVLAEDSGRVVTGWVAPPLAGLALTGTLFRPALVDLTTGVSVALLGTVFVAAASLPLSVLIRGTFARCFEAAPPDVMRSVVESEEKRGDRKSVV